jgi:hypothetical protein
MSEAMMSWMEKAVIDPGPVERLMHRSVKVRRWMGFKSDHAMHDAALALGTSPRRVRMFVRGEVFKVATDEYRRLLTRWWVDIDRQAAELTALAIKLKNEAENEWSEQNQLSLPLEFPPAEPRLRASPFGDGM